MEIEVQRGRDSRLRRPQKTILVVDDDFDIREVICDRLSSVGYAVLTAHNGAQALELVRVSQLQGMLLDIRMPGMDGLAVLATVHRDQPQLPIIVVTASVGKDNLENLKCAGAVDYVTKPLVYGELIDKIARHF
jgi:CheY-like chemotaxis protein